MISGPGRAIVAVSVFATVKTAVSTRAYITGDQDIAVSGDSRYASMLNSGSGTIGIFAVKSDGSLTNVGEIDGLPKAAGLNGIAAL